MVTMTDTSPQSAAAGSIDAVKIYGGGDSEVRALDGVTVSFEAGRFTAIMGPSGSGKSTLLNLIAGIDRPDAGVLRVGGLDITTLGEGALADWRARHIGFIFQFYNLLPVLTAYENIELPLTLTGLTRGERRERVALALDMVNLSDRAAHYPSELSGGQQQRVAIARAIISDPMLIVADEPTGDLDRVSAGEILLLMQRLTQELGSTIIMVTHDAQAARAAGRMVYLEKGELNLAPVAA